MKRIFCCCCYYLLMLQLLMLQLLLLLLCVCAQVSEDQAFTADQSPGLSCLRGFEDLGFYNGSVSHTKSGSVCLKWTQFPDYIRQYPNRGLGDHNRCRNPDGEPEPWCFFRQSSGSVSWAHCDCHQGAVRLAGGPRGSVSGRVEVYQSGQWGAVCGSQWTQRDASVVCRQLGLSQVGSALLESPFGPGSLFHYQRLGCRGDEDSVLQCPSRKFVPNDCNRGNEAAVTCAEPEGHVIPLRLVGGVEDFEGRVEVYFRGGWGSICAEDWDHPDAEVVCRQLDLGGVAKAQTWPQQDPPVLMGVRCTGNELSLDQCPQRSLEPQGCEDLKVAGVSCDPFTDGAVRLLGSDHPWEGRVEVYHAGLWGTVCDDHWTQINAQVVCRQLGFSGPAQLSKDVVYEEGSGPILLDEVRCLGSENSLLDCSHSGFGEHDCSHSEDVVVSCGTGTRSGSEETSILSPPPGPVVRLVRGESRKEGRVEIFLHHRWGTVCDDGWNDVSAAVVCRQLGFSGAAKARSMAYFGEGRGPIHLDNVRCSGSESSLDRCPADETHDCRHSEDAGVICDYTLEPVGGALVTCGQRLTNQRRRRRIIGGDQALRGQWPWQVSLWLRSQSKRPLCGASLISSCWMITAAHCFKRFGTDPSRYVLRLGDYHTEEQDDFERTLTPERIVIHRKYQSPGWGYDIALLRLKGTEGSCVAFNPHTGPVCLPEAGDPRETKRPEVCVITGWGITDWGYSQTLLQARVQVLPSAQCRKRYGGDFNSRMLCAGSWSERHRVDSCQGDSGGGLVCRGEEGRWVLTGVISWGHGCGNPSYPGVYTRVRGYLRWIHKVINKAFNS